MIIRQVERGRANVKVLVESDSLSLEHPSGGMGSASGLDRYCAYLSRRGWRIMRTGANRFRRAFPPASLDYKGWRSQVHADHSKDVFYLEC